MKAVARVAAPAARCEACRRSADRIVIGKLEPAVVAGDATYLCSNIADCRRHW